MPQGMIQDRRSQLLKELRMKYPTEPETLLVAYIEKMLAAERPSNASTPPTGQGSVDATVPGSNRRMTGLLRRPGIRGAVRGMIPGASGLIAEYGPADPFKSAVELAADSRFLGLPGILTDAFAAGATDATWPQLRDERLARAAALPKTVQLGSALLGGLRTNQGLANVSSTFKNTLKAAERQKGWTGIGKRAALRAVDAGAQGGIGATGQFIGSSGGAVMPAIYGTALGVLLGPTLGPLFEKGASYAGKKFPSLGKWMGDVPTEKLSQAQRRAVEAIEIQEGRLPSGPDVERVQGGPDPIAYDAAKSGVRGLAFSAGLAPAGREMGTTMLNMRHAPQQQSLENSILYATGINNNAADELSARIARLAHERNIRNVESAERFDLAKQNELAELNKWGVQNTEKKNANLAAIAAQKTRITNAANNYNDTEAKRIAAHQAASVAYNKSQRTMEDVLAVMGNLGDSRKIPSPYATLTEITTARDAFADQAFPAIRKKLAGIPHNVKQWFARANESEVLRAAGREAENNRLERIANDPSYPPLPEMTIEGKIVKVPDAEFWQDVQTANAQAANTIPDAKPLKGARVYQNSAKVHNDWLAINQHRDFKAADAAFKKSWDEQRDFILSTKSLKFTLDPLQPNQSIDARLQARLTMTPEEILKDQNLIRAKLNDEIRDSGISPEEFIKRLRQKSSKESAQVYLAWGAGAREDMLKKLARPANPGAYVKLTKPKKEIPLSKWESSPKPPAVAQAPVPEIASGQELSLGRGFDIFTTPSSPTGATPEKSLPAVRDFLATLSPADRRAFQEAGGAALQGIRRSGKNLDPGTKEWAEQVALASQTPEGAAAFQKTAAAWATADVARQALIGGKGPVVGINPESVGQKVFNMVTPSTAWSASRVAHEIANKGLDENSENMASEIMRIVLSNPGTIQKSITELQNIRGANNRLAHRAANKLSRIVTGQILGYRGNPTREYSNNNLVDYPLPVRPDTVATSPKAPLVDTLNRVIVPADTTVADTATSVAAPMRKAPSPYNTIQRPLVQRDSTPALDPRNLPALISSLFGMGASNRPVVPGAQGARQLPSMPEARSSTDPRRPIVVTSPGPSIIDQVTNAVGMSPPLSVSPKTPTSARLPSGLVQYTSIRDVPKTFYDETMEIIRREEGFVSYVYDDKAKRGTNRRLYMIDGRWKQKDGKEPEGTPTIGHGLTNKNIVNRGTITEKESEVAARAHMASDVAQMIRLGSPISPIIISESYNMGIRRMSEKNIFNLLKRGQYKEAVDSLATVTTSGDRRASLMGRRFRASQKILEKKP